RTRFALLAQVSPEVQIPDEVGMLVDEASVLLPRGILVVARPLPRIRDRQRRRDDEHFSNATFVRRLKDHAADTRVERQPSELSTDVGDRAGTVESTEFLQQHDSVA